MVFFVLTRTGYEELLNRFGKMVPNPLWANKDVFSADELDEMRQQGSEVTNFTYIVNIQDSVEIAEAVQTIQEHHPGQRVWVEFPTGS